MRSLYVTTVFANLSLISSFNFNGKTQQQREKNHCFCSHTIGKTRGYYESRKSKFTPAQRHSLSLSSKRFVNVGGAGGGGEFPSKRRKAPNNRVAISWVVEAIEKVLQTERNVGRNTVDDDNALLAALDNIQKGTFRRHVVVCGTVRCKHSFSLNDLVREVDLRLECMYFESICIPSILLNQSLSEYCMQWIQYGLSRMQ